MGATAVQVTRKYERTTDPRRMLTHKLLNEAIRTEWEGIKGFIPARTATSMRYDKGATKAVAWDEGGKETKIDLPLKDGWYVPDGNPFAIPNGRKSNADDPGALYLLRHQDRKFSGPVGRGDVDFDGRRDVSAYGDWSDVSGVALVGRESRVSSLGTPDAGHETALAAPLVRVPQETLVEIADPKTLLERANTLRAVAEYYTRKLEDSRSPDHRMYIQPILDEAAFLTDLAGKLQAIQTKG